MLKTNTASEVPYNPVDISDNSNTENDDPDDLVSDGGAVFDTMIAVLVLVAAAVIPLLLFAATCIL